MADTTSITVGIKTAMAVNAIVTCLGMCLGMGAGSALILWLGRGVYREAHAEGVRQGRRVEQDMSRRQALGLPLTKSQ